MHDLPPNPYGRFSPDGSAFAITRHDTPMPWTNIISNGRYGIAVSQNGGGFSWLDNSQLNVITRWEMDLVRDMHGRFLYLADLDAPDSETDALWSLAPAPCRIVPDDYQCEHALGTTAFTGTHRGIHSTWTLAVPPGETAEVWTVTLTNTTDRPRRLRLCAYLEWCCGVAPDTKREFHRLFLNAKDHPKVGSARAISATKNMWDVPQRHEKEHWNRPWPYGAALAVSAGTFDRTIATADKEAFLGRYHDPAKPATMRTPEGPAGKFGRFGDAVAALGGDLTLEPGASITIAYSLACSDTEDEAVQIAARLADPAVAVEAVEASHISWREHIDPVAVKTGVADFDTLNNHWLPYQAISGRLWGRTGYYQQSGAFGFRDQLQDSNVWLPRDPERTAEQIMLHAGLQFADGRVYHWWHPLAEFGLQTQCSDDYLWLPYLTARYMRDTGDAAILDRTSAFADDETKATLLDHCTRSLDRFETKLSERGLPLIGSCDWNDGLSAVGIEGRGESIWLAFFVAEVLRDWHAIFTDLGDTAKADRCAKRRDALIEAANAHAWDGAWYRRATNDAGEWVGTESNAHGKIYLNPQTWAILTDAAPADRESTAWASVMEHLAREMGPLLLHPAYDTPDGDVGYITRYPPGLRENGGVYMHAATWALAAACKRGDRAAATHIWNTISPIRRGGDADGYVAEPYATPGNVDGPTSERPGRAGWTWYTGSAAWLHTVSLEWVLGIRSEWEGLRIDPCPIEGMGAVSASRQWRGRTIEVSFDASDCVDGASPTLTVNGKQITGSLLTEADCNPSGTTRVEVTWHPATSAENSGTLSTGDTPDRHAATAVHTKPIHHAERTSS